MKEFEIKPNNLTSEPQPRILNGGVFSMEGKSDIAPQNSNPGPEHAGKTPQAPKLGIEKPISAEKQEQARRLWEESNRGRVLLPDEKWTQEELIKRGLPPISGGSQEDIDDATRRMEEITKQREQRQAAGARGTGGPGEEAGRQSVINTINEAEIENPILKQHVNEINEFLTSRRVSIEDYGALLKKINDLQLPGNISNAEKARFEQDKQKISGAIAEKITSSIPDGQRAEMIKKSLALQEAIEREDYDAIDTVVRSIDIDDYFTYAPAISDVVERMQGKGKDQMLEYLLEFGVERIISIADINPKVQYPQFNLYQTQNLDSVTQIARRYDERHGDKGNKMFKYLTDLKTKRYAMHELFRSMKNRENYVRLVTELLRQDGLAFVEKEIVGVPDVKILYEEVLGSDLSFKKGWLDHKDFEKADRDVMNIFNQDALLPENNKKYVDEKGVARSRPLREWEINRAVLVGRSLHAASQRRLTYAVMGDVPEGDVDEMLKSVESEFLARILAPFKLVPERFFSWPIAKRWQEFFLTKLKRNKDGTTNNQKYGYIDGKGRVMGLYGKRQNSLAILDLGITDPQSNSWRSRLLFIKQKGYSRETLPNGDKVPIGLYLDEIKRRAEAKVGKEVNHNIRKKLINGDFNDSIRERIKDQRLFLGNLMRYPDLDNQNKREIWENVVKHIPSRIAAFFPEETLQLVKEEYNIVDRENDSEQVKTEKRNQALENWNELKVKLWRAERARVKNDAEALRTDEKGERIGQGNTKDLSDFYTYAQLDEKEQNLVKNLINFGMTKVATDEKGEPVADSRDAKGGLINVVFPFTAFFDDAPKTDWDNLADEDYDRILVNDHSAFQKGYGNVIGLISNPGAKPEVVVKAFAECFDEIQSPLGVPDSQKRMEPIVSAQLSMGKMNNLAKWFGPIMKMMREPRSEIERFNLKAEIAQGAKDQSDILDGIAQHSVLSDNPEEADEDGNTQLMSMKKEHGVDLKAVFAEYIRIIFLLLGPVAGLQFLKMVLPEEFSKSLG